MATRRYDLVIWDWNGTILDDAWLCVEIMNGALARRGMPSLTMERYGRILEFPIINYYRALGFDFAVEPFEAVATEFIEEYYRRWRECGLTPGVIETLAAAAAAGCRQVLLSAAPHAYLEEAVKHFGLAGFFGEISGLDDHYATSKIENGRKLMARNGYASQKALLVGDTQHDREVAAALGVDCVLIPSRHCCRERLEACDVRLLSALGDLVPILSGAA